MRPLVEPGPALTAPERERYSRHLLLPGLGEEGQRRLRAARVAVIGAGGLGAPVLQYLAAAGVGRITIVDDDDVDLSNLQRQVIHRTRDVGRAKTASAADAVRALNPLVEVAEHRGRLTGGTVDAVLAGHHLVLDGTDNFPTRYLVDDACARLGLPYVWGSVFRFAAQVAVFWADPPGDAGVPAVRLRDLFPEAPPPGSVPSCAEGGVLGSMTGQVGSLMATEAIKAITGIGEVAIGRVLVLDALAARWREVPLTGRGPRAWAAASGPEVREVTAADLAAELAAGAHLVDVREPAERAVAVIPGALPVPLGAILDGTALADLPPGSLVLHCHSGVRSHQAALALAAAGREDVANLTGGIVAWLREFSRHQV